MNPVFHDTVIRVGRHVIYYYPQHQVYMYREIGRPRREFIKPGELLAFLSRMDKKTGVYGAFTAWTRRILRQTTKLEARYVAHRMISSEQGGLHYGEAT